MDSIIWEIQNVIASDALRQALHTDLSFFRSRHIPSLLIIFVCLELRRESLFSRLTFLASSTCVQSSQRVSLSSSLYMCVCVYARARVRACVCVYNIKDIYKHIYNMENIDLKNNICIF